MGAPIVRYEAGQTPQSFEEMTDSGDATKFEASFEPWSNVSGHEPVIAPYGLLTGGAITATATDNQVSVAALTASMAGASGADADGVVSVSSGTVLASRGVTSDTHRITSITVNSSGALAAVAGVDSTAFSETRGANGGPPYIPVGSIEIGQVRLSSVTDAVVTAGEIFTVVGLHREESGFPVYNADFGRGEITFASELPKIHTGDLPKKVYIRGSTPLFSQIPNASEWTPAESTYSVTSTDTYDGPVGSASASLGQASFTAQLKDGITDNFIASKGKELWFEFRPDRDKLLPKQLTQGVLGISRTFPAGGGGNNASVTVTASKETLDRSS